jgi:transposase
MLADQLDYVVGVDPHRDVHALAIVEVRSGGVVLEASVSASSDGYASALELARQHAPGRRAFAIEGTGSFGAGLTRFLVSQQERVLEVGRLRASDARAARATRSTRSGRRAASSGKRRRPSRGPAGSGRRCGPCWPRARARSTRAGRGSASSAIC